MLVEVSKKVLEVCCVKLSLVSASSGAEMLRIKGFPGENVLQESSGSGDLEGARIGDQASLLVTMK